MSSIYCSYYSFTKRTVLVQFIIEDVVTFLEHGVRCRLLYRLASQALLIGRRNISGRPGGCRTNNLTISRRPITAVDSSI